MLGGLISHVFHNLPQLISSLPIRQFGTVFNATASKTIAGGSWSLIPVRTKIRNRFPIARESYRIKVLGWKTRMSTPLGRRIIMRRILKGKHVLSH